VSAVGEAVAAPEVVRAWAAAPSRESTGHCIHTAGQLLAQIDTVVMNEDADAKECRDGTREEEPLTQGSGATGIARIPFAAGDVGGQTCRKSVDRPRNPRGQSSSRDVVGVAPEAAAGNCTDSMAASAP
jgi:hypothetical protein